MDRQRRLANAEHSARPKGDIILQVVYVETIVDAEGHKTEVRIPAEYDEPEFGDGPPGGRIAVVWPKEKTTAAPSCAHSAGNHGEQP